jgi:hypothetical protein
MCETLLQRGADIDAVISVWCNTGGEWTALTVASVYGYPPRCTFLLNAGARVDAVCSLGKTALQHAKTHGKKECVDAIRAWLKDRDAAVAFAHGTMHARRAHKRGDWTNSKLFDKNLIGEITGFVTPRAANKSTQTNKHVESKQASCRL